MTKNSSKGLLETLGKFPLQEGQKGVGTVEVIKLRMPQANNADDVAWVNDTYKAYLDTLKERIQGIKDTAFDQAKVPPELANEFWAAHNEFLGFVTEIITFLEPHITCGMCPKSVLLMEIMCMLSEYLRGDGGYFSELFPELIQELHGLTKGIDPSTL